MRLKLSFCLIFVFSATRLFGQLSPSEALPLLQNKLRTMETYRIRVEVQTTYNNGQSSPPMQASLTVQGDKFALESPIQQIRYDGQNLYTFDKQHNEVNIESVAKSDNPLMSPSLLLQFNPSDFQQTEQGNKLILNSKLQQLPFKTMVMTFHNDQIKEIEIKQLKNDNQTRSVTFKLGPASRVTNIDKSHFVFDKKANPGADIVDFR